MEYALTIMYCRLADQLQSTALNIRMNVLMWQVTLSTVLTSILIITALKADTGDHAAVVSGVHGFCCALWLGTAAWGAIFQGVMMLQLLPRHDFGNLQSRVIPAMFQFGNLCMGLAVLTFLHQHPLTSLSGQDFKQLFVMTISLLSSMINNVWFLPEGTRIMHVCHKIERDVGEGRAIRYLDMKKFEGDHKYHMLRKQFAFHHSGTQLSGIISCACVAYRVAYLCSRSAI
ncbi:transmembrane protein 205-like [Sycon ciliatum]|uniref:transmembrane protein 205-like n=1 Tax=Sycon ciliatum TaxID=27933 RepID=UPI0031F66EBF